MKNGPRSPMVLENVEAVESVRRKPYLDAGLFNRDQGPGWHAIAHDGDSQWFVGWTDRKNPGGNRKDLRLAFAIRIEE